MSWLEWLTVPVAFLFTNIFEWAVHKFIMHRPVNIKGLRAIYERHTLNHHQFFSDEEMRMLTRLLPHARRAYQLEARVRSELVPLFAGRAALDAMATPAITGIKSPSMEIDFPDCRLVVWYVRPRSRHRRSSAQRL